MVPLVVDLDSAKQDDAARISIGGLSTSKAASTLGEGVELLMNDKRKQASEDKEKDTSIKNIASLEDELNSLSGSRPETIKKGDAINLVMNSSIGLAPDSDKSKKILPIEIPGLGKSTAKITVDKGPLAGLANVPLDPDKAAAPRLNREDMLKEKFSLLRKFETLERRGVQLTKKYSMDSSLDEMKGEYEMIVSEKEKNNSVKFQGKMLMAAITGLEFLNTKFDPFDVQLDGWAEQMNENMTDYDEIFAELHEKYRTKAKMAPELKLLFQLTGSAIMVHMTNTMFKSSMPGMDDIMRQNPELMQQFTKAAVNSMEPEQPGFSSFMGDMMGTQVGGRDAPTSSSIHGPPPAPVRSKATERDAPASRPDMAAARSTLRPDMKGPSDIESLLSGLKKKLPDPTASADTIKIDDSSTISIKDLKEMADAKLPTRSKKGSGPQKATISLDV